MIKRETLSQLMSLTPEEYLITTLYLAIDGTPNPAYLIVVKDLIKKKQQELQTLNLAAEVRKSAESDLKKISNFVRLRFERNGIKTLIIFSCAAKKIWQVLTLTLPLRNQLEIGSRPYVRPLLALLENYHRFLAILVERSKARLFEVYAGEINEYIDVFDVIPAKVRVGGFGGYEERRIERHIEDHVRRHFKHVADVAFDLYKRYAHDSVILLGSEQNTNEFKSYLRSSLQERVAASSVLEIGALSTDVMQCVMKIERQMKEKEDRRLLERLMNQVRSGALGVVGLDSTIRALQQGQVNTLIVDDQFSKEGYRCGSCESLSVHPGNCDYCGGTLQDVKDIVEQAVLDAQNSSCEVKYVMLPDSELSRAGKIGAILRFKA
jgi:peptide chain release factor subunit 1